MNDRVLLCNKRFSHLRPVRDGLSPADVEFECPLETTAARADYASLLALTFFLKDSFYFD